VLVGIVVAGGFAAKKLYDQAMGVRGHLEAAMTDVSTVKSAVLAMDTEAAQAAAADLVQKTTAAKSATGGRLWSMAESVPAVGDDIAAIRLVAEATDRLAADVIVPASKLSLAAFQPKDGRIDIDAITSLLATLDDVEAGVTAAVDDLASIDRADLIPEVASGVQRLDEALAEIKPMIGPVRDVVSVLPNALGAEGPRNYLLMFQGTSEARSLGGNAAVFTVLEANRGALNTTASITSQDFHNVLPESVVPLDPGAEQIFGDKIGRYTADFTMVPDFPDAVRILDGWWQREGFPPTSAVLSLDPVALSYILAATGPITLPTGDVLNADNAVAMLLNDVYFKYTDPIAQNAFFTATADAVFSKITSGGFSPAALMAAVTKSVEEHRLLYLSDDKAEMALVAKTPMTGVMPEDRADTSVMGVFINDNTGSKMSYYLDMAVNACVDGTTLRGKVTLDSSVTAEQAAMLPRYISGPYFTPGTISTFVAIYGPTGSKASDIRIDGNPARVLATGTHLGRPVFKVEVRNVLQSTHTLSYKFDSNRAQLGAAEVWHTPMTRATEVTTGCN
jgi:hypothetical protein